MRKQTSKNYENERFLEYDCPFMTTLHFIGKRWKPAVLWKIKDGNVRVVQLKSVLPYISDKMLANTLNELEQDGILVKKTFDEVPLRTKYSLSEFGLSLFPVIEVMNNWGNVTKSMILKQKKV